MDAESHDDKEFLEALLEIDFKDEHFSNLNDTSTLICILETIILKLKQISYYHSNISSSSDETHALEYEELFDIKLTEEDIPQENQESQLIQTYIFELISGFKLTISLYEKANPQDYTPHVKLLFCKFFKHAFRALDAYTVPNLGCDSPENDWKNGQKAAENLASVLITRPKYRVVDTFFNFIPLILKSIEKNALVKIFTNCLLAHKETSIVVSILLLDYFVHITSMKKFEDGSSEQARVSGQLINDILQSLIIFPDNIRPIHQKYLVDIIKHCVKRIPNAVQPKYLFCLMKCIFIALHNEKLKHIQYRLYHILPTVFSAFDMWLQTPLECRTWCLLLETVLAVIYSMIPNSIVFLLSQVEIFIKCLIFSLKENPELALKALNVFETFLDHVKYDSINIHILPLKEELLNALYDALRCPVEGVNKIAFQLLGKMGGYNRDNFIESSKLQETQGSSYSLSVTFKKSKGTATLLLDRIIIDFAYKDISNSKVDESRKKHWWSLVKTILKSCIEFWSLPSVQPDSLNSIVHTLEAMSIEKDSSGSLIDGHKIFDDLLDMETIFDSPELKNIDNDLPKPMIIDNDSHQVTPSAHDAIAENADFGNFHKAAFMIMFAAAEIPCLSAEVKPFMKLVFKTLIELITAEKNEQLYYLIDAVVEAISFSKDDRSKVNISPLKDFVNVAIESVGSEVWNPASFEYIYFEYMLKKVSNLCYDQTWEAKFAGCQAIYFFMEITSYSWKVTHIHQFLKPLFYCMADIEGKISFGTAKEAKNVLLNSEDESSIESFIKRYGSDEGRNNDVFNTIRQILIEELASSSYVTRKQVRKFLCLLYTEEDFNQLVMPCELFDNLDFLLNLHEDFDFCCKLNMPLFSADIDGEHNILYNSLKSLCVFSDMLVLTDGSTQSKVIRQCCGALYALCFNFVNEKTIQELFDIYTNALFYPVSEVSAAALKSLQHISEKNILTEKMVSDWASSFVDPLRDGRALDEYQLKKLVYFLQIFKFQNLTDLGNKLFSLTMSWKRSVIFMCENNYDPTAIGAHIEIGALLVESLNLLPISNPIMIKGVLSAVSDLQPYLKIILKSSLRESLLKFCRKFPEKTMSDLLNRMKDNAEKNFILFEELLKTENSDIFYKSIKEESLMESSSECVLQILPYIVKYNVNWFDGKSSFAKRKLLSLWNDDKLLVSSSISAANKFKLLARCIMQCFKHEEMEFEILFDLMKVFISPIASNFYLLKDFVLNTVAKTYSIHWKIGCFLTFISQFFQENPHPAAAEILQFIIIPSFYDEIMKGEEDRLLFGSLNEDTNTVLDAFSGGVCHLSEHSEEAKLMFLKLAIILTASIKIMKDLRKNIHQDSYYWNYSGSCASRRENGQQSIHLQTERKADLTSAFIEESRKLAKSFLVHKQAVHYSCLLLLILSFEEKNANSLKVILSNLVSSCPVEEEHVIQQAFYICTSNLPKQIFSQCCSHILEEDNFDVKSILNMILLFHQRFYSVRHVFLKCIVTSAIEESTFKDFQCDKRTIDLIEVIILWGERYMETPDNLEYDLEKNVIDAENAKWVVNFLFEKTCLVPTDSFGKSLSERCASLLKKVFLKKIFPLKKLEFGSWLQDLLRNISENPKMYEHNCEVFKLITQVCRHMPKCLIISFVNYLYVYFESLIKCSQFKESLCNFLSELVQRYPPGKFHSKFEKLYNPIQTMCLDKCLYFNSKAMVLGAVGSYFPACLDKLKTSLISDLQIVTPNYIMQDKLGNSVDNKTTVNVALEFVKKPEIFLKINEEDMKKLFGEMSALIDKLSHAEIMLKIIDIMELCKDRIPHKNLSCRSARTIFQWIFILLEKICKRVDSDFSHMKEMNTRLFENLISLRSSVSYSSVWTKNETDKDELFHYVSWISRPDIAINVKSDIIDTVFYMAGVFYRSENRQTFFSVVAKELEHDIFKSLMFICGSRWKTADSQFWIEHCLNLISMLISNVYLTPDITNSEATNIFTSIVELCDGDKFLTEHIWEQLFPEIWIVLGSEKQEEILHSDSMKSFILRISSKEIDLVPNPNYVFINVLLKCNPAFCLYFNQKDLQRYFDFQTLSCILLENQIFSQNFSENYDKYINILNEIYIHLKESDVYYCYNQKYAKHIPRTIQAMSEYQEGNIYKSFDIYKKIMIAFAEEPVLQLNDAERNFCMNQLIRCHKELSTWNFHSTEASSSSSLNCIQTFSNWNFVDVRETSGLHSLRMKKMVDEKEIDAAVTQCIKKWKSLPQIFLSHQHYALLQLVQQHTEFIEAWNLQHTSSDSDVLDYTKKIESLYSGWLERPYLPSDDLSFLIELFHVRQIALKDVCTKFSFNSKNSESTQAHIPHKYIIDVATHGSNDFVIELCSAAVKYQNMYLRNLRFENFSYQNAFKLIKLKFSSLLTEIKKSSRNLTPEEKANLLEKAQHLIKVNVAEQIDLDNKGIFSAHLLDIYQESEIPIGHLQILDVQQNGKLWEIQSKYYEKLFNKRQDIDIAEKLLRCLLKACQLGGTLVATKLMPKILYILEFDNDENFLAQLLQEHFCDIPVSYWLPFLSFFISHFLDSLVQEKSLEVEDKEKETSLSLLYMRIVQKLGITYPQEVFFSIQCLKGLKSEVMVEGKDVISEKYDEIVTSLKETSPRLISKLEYIIRDFEKFKPQNPEIYLCNLKQVLQVTYIFILKNFKNGHNNIYNSKEFFCYLEEFLEPEVHLIEKLLGYPGSIQSLKLCTLDIIVDLLEKYISNLSEICKKLQSQPFILHEKCLFLSNFHLLEEDINLFGQSTLMDHSSHIKIIKFLPKVDVLKWSDSNVYQISVLGHNGKIYSYIIKEDSHPVETLRTIKYMQTLENLNLILENDVQNSKRFLKFYFPKITTVGSGLMLVLHHHEFSLYQDIFQMNSSILDGIFFSNLLENPAILKNTDNMLLHLFKLIQNEVPEDTFINWVEKLYPSPLEKFAFRKQFVKQISMLIAVEYFFNMSVRKQLVILKNSGMVSALHLEFNLDCIQTNSLLLTPNISKYIGPLYIDVVAENIVCISSCLKENQDVMAPLLHLLTKEYFGGQVEQTKKYVGLILDKLKCHRSEVQKLLQSSTKLNYLCQINPLLNPWF